MKALTICQPYAHLICLPDDHEDAKRVENRTWATDYHGPLAIHAGKSKGYMVPGDLERYPNMVFGAIIGVAELRGCVRISQSGSAPLVPHWALRNWPWLTAHKHTEGPVCWVLAEVRRLEHPVVCRGSMGLWDVNIDELRLITANLRAQGAMP